MAGLPAKVGTRGCPESLTVDSDTGNDRWRGPLCPSASGLSGLGRHPNAEPTEAWMPSSGVRDYVVICGAYPEGPSGSVPAGPADGGGCCTGRRTLGTHDE